MRKTLRAYMQEAQWIKGCFVHPSKLSTARRVYALRHGPIPSGMWVLHICDNPRFIFDLHLWLGTPSENTRDAIKKGRFIQLLKKGNTVGPRFKKGNIFGHKKGFHPLTEFKRGHTFGLATRFKAGNSMGLEHRFKAGNTARWPKKA